MPNSYRIISGPNQDITGRVLTYDSQSPVYAATISPVITQAFTKIGPVALTGALTMNPSIAQSYITMLFTNGTAGALVVTMGANVSNVGVLSVAIGKKGSVTCVFDGATWVETGRAATV
jgi:hypothetical protein